MPRKIIKSVLFFFLLLPIFWKARGDIYSKEELDFVASFNNAAITKFDLDNFLRLEQYDKVLKDKSEKKYRETLEEYIDFLAMEKIVNDAQISEMDKNENKKEEKKNYWAFFSDNFKTNLSPEEFCKNNGIDLEFFKKYITVSYLWVKFVERDIVGKTRLDEFYAEQFMEFSAKGKDAENYNLSEIVVRYDNLEEKQRAKELLEKIYRDAVENGENKFGEYAKKYSQGLTAKDGGVLGWISAGDLAEDAAREIGKIGEGQVAKVFCSDGDNAKGDCFLLRLNRKQFHNSPNEGEKQSIREYIGNKKIGEKIRFLIEKTRNEAIIRYW
ncbi:MAG: peptidyl-prolyl cis-trans isomerase [Rickettsiales bacterium]|jgi:parvulin-like peptidyl-prolyl isomerase|nr:peptidyl-prolyl cis-trans isomerase [Rickettsiales bacterium]